MAGGERRRRACRPSRPRTSCAQLMNMATAEEMGDLEFEARRDLPAFKEFPWTTTGPTASRELPEGFQVVVIGSRLQRPGDGRPARAARHPLRHPRPPARAGRHLERQPLPRRPGRHHLDHLRVQLREELPVERSTSAAAPRCASTSTTSPRSTALAEKLRFGRNAEAGHVRRGPQRLGRSRPTRPTASRRTRPTSSSTRSAPSPTPTTRTSKARRASRGRCCTRRAGRPTSTRTGKRDRRHRQRLHRRAAARADRRRSRAGLRLPAHPAVDQPARRSTASPSSPRSAGCSTTSRATGTGGATWPSPRSSRPTASSSLDEEWKAQGGKFNPLNDKMRDDLTLYIKAQTGGRQDLIDKLIPDYAPFSRRPVVDNGWYRSLTRDNVELVTDRIARLTPKGVETADGTVREVDVDRHRDRLRDRQVPVARRLHRQGRHEHPRLLVQGRPARVPEHDGAELPQHVHALRAQLAAAVGRHRPADLVRDLVGLHRPAASCG